VALGGTSLTLSDPTLTTLEAAWTPAGGDGLTGYEIRHQPKQEVGIANQPDVRKMLH